MTSRCCAAAAKDIALASKFRALKDQPKNNFGFSFSLTLPSPERERGLWRSYFSVDPKGAQLNRPVPALNCRMTPRLESGRPGEKAGLLAVPDSRSHATLLAAQLTPAFACFLYAHARLRRELLNETKGRSFNARAGRNRTETLRSVVQSLSENRPGEGDSPILLRGLRKIGTVPGGSRIGS
jgi:hypothetical protein